MRNPLLDPPATESLGSAFFVYITKTTVNFNPASVAAVTVSLQDVTVPGVQVGDIVLKVEPQAALSTGLAIAGYRVKAANTVAVSFINPTAGAVDNAAVDLVFVVARLRTP